MTSVWIMCHASDRSVADLLGAELTRACVVIVATGANRPTVDYDGVVVMLSGSTLPSESLRDAREHGDRLVPVSVDGAVHPEFGDTNQIMLPTVGYAAAAAQAVAVVSLGGRTLARLRDLFTSAGEWDRSDRRRNRLLRNRDQVAAARGLVAVCPPDLGSDVAAAYVDASAAYHRRRANLLVTGAASLAVILLAATILALVLRNASVTAAEELEREARQETSKRLAGLSTSVLDDDPDLPRIAAAEALAQAPTVEAMAAARGVLVQTLAHRSIPLDILPTDVSVGRDVFAVMDVTGLTQVRDLDTGYVLRSITPTKRTGMVELSPDGAFVAMFGQDEFEVVSTASGEQELSGTAGFGRWVGDVLLLVDDGKIVAYSFGHGEPAPKLPSRRGDVTAFDVSADLSLIATLVGDRVRVEEFDGGRQGWVGTVQDAFDVTFAPAGELFVLGGATSQVVREPGSRIADSAGVDLALFRNAVPLSGAGLVGLSGDGLFSAAYGYAETYATTTLSDGRAHLGITSDVAPVPGGGFATVGGDRFVRLWEEPRLPVYPAGSTPQFAWARSLPNAREGVRPSLALSADADVLTVSQGSPAMVAMVDARTLEPLGRRVGAPLYLGDIEVRAHPCGDAGLLLVAGSDGISTIFDVAAADGEEVDATVNPASGGVSSSHLGCAPDGSELVWADSAAIRFHKVGSGLWSETPVASGASPLSVLDASTPMSVATSDGGRVDARGNPFRITPDGIGAEAAGDSTDSMYIAVGSDGVLYRSSPTSGPARLGAVSQDLEAFAVRVSPDGTLAAVIGVRETEIYSTATGDMYLSLTPGNRALRTEVRDVAFVKDGLVVIDENGALMRYEIPDDGELAEALVPAPRGATALEREVVLGLEP